MKDEIKEILDKLKIKSGRYDHYLKYNMSYENKDEDYEAHLLLYYITNLQQIEQDHQRINGELREENKKLQEENERLKEECKEWKENHKAVCIQRDNILDNIVKNTEERIDYKSRNEKAAEYIKECIDSEDIYEQFLSTGETKEVLNILKGGDNNE